jgi:hypothetical protein
MRGAALIGVAVLVAGTAAGAATPKVTSTSTTTGADVTFPKKDVEKAPRIVADDGGTLSIVRSKDGRQLWVDRGWDDGSDDVTRFDLDPAAPPKSALQFVDGLGEPEAWVVDADAKQLVRPSTGRAYPLVPARAAPAPKPATKVQWTAFVAACPETKSACVYFGKADDVCARYFAARHGAPVTSRELLIAPQGCADGKR